jgi:hypothetical protein
MLLERKEVKDGKHTKMKKKRLQEKTASQS